LTDEAVAVSVATEGELPGETLSRVRSVCERGAEVLLVIDQGHVLSEDLVSPQAPYCLISDHLNLTGANPLVGPNAGEWGPRFQDLTDAWDPDIRSTLRQAGLSAGVGLSEGIVAGMVGSSHTAAEASMLRGLGADLVSSGFVAEAISGRHAGRRMAGIAITSEAAAADTEAVSGLLTLLLASLP
jgi:purine-nucleoside phosphorylase